MSSGPTFLPVAPVPLVSTATLYKHHTHLGSEFFPSSANQPVPFKAQLTGHLLLAASLDYSFPAAALAEFLKRWLEHLVGSWLLCPAC